MRPEFFKQLYETMKTDDRVWLLVGDLGYGGADKIRDDFPDRFINCGASEQAMLGLACGLSLEGKIPFVYTITPFLYRGFETIRTYINHEKLNVKLCGSGRDKDYELDGYSHNAGDARKIFDTLPNIEQNYPDKLSKDFVSKMCKNNKPEFLSLKRGGI